MATTTVWIDDGVKEETTRIASQLGLTFNGVVNILLRRFNVEQGFPFDVKLEPAREKTVFDMSSAEFETACRDAVANRDDVPSAPYVTSIDDNGHIYKRFKDDGRTEYVLT